MRNSKASDSTLLYAHGKFVSCHCIKSNGSGQVIFIHLAQYHQSQIHFKELYNRNSMQLPLFRALIQIRQIPQ